MKKEIELLIHNILNNKSLNGPIEIVLSKFCFSNPKSAYKNFLILNDHIDFKKLFPKFFPRLIHDLSESFDPDRGLNNFERFSEKILDKNYFYTLLENEPQLLKALTILFSGSQHLSDILFNDPAIFDWLKLSETLNESKDKDHLYRELWDFIQKTSSHEEKLGVLRQFKKREYLRIGLRDLMGKADVVETIKDISHLADVCLQNSYEFCEKELINKYGTPMVIDPKGNNKKAEFAILGMGKLGGEELNFSSDIDLIYIYSTSEGKTSGAPNNSLRLIPLSNHEFFIKLAKMITDSIGLITSDGSVFRVDLGLRPEGKNGDLASSLRSCEIYYESWGQTWERQALIKARVSAGNEGLGKRFEKIKQHFVYRKYLDFQAIDEIRNGKIKIENKLKKMNKQMDVKLSRGGIREIEFIVQIFQLIYGGREESIRERNTLKALKKIFEHNFITENDYSCLVKAYRFLRDLENKIQISFGLQSHCIPAHVEDQMVLAKKMGIIGIDQKDAAEKLLSAYQGHAQNTHKIFDDLFKSKENHEKKFPSKSTPNETEINPSLIIDQFPFKNKQRVLKNLKLLEYGQTYSHPSLRSQVLFGKLIPDILRISSRQNDPDESINNLERFFHSFKSREIFFDLLKETPKLLKLLLVLFGNSVFLSNILIRQPDLLDSLLDLESIYRFKPKDKMKMELTKFLEESDKREDIRDVLRKFKKGEELRIGLRFLLKEANLDNTFSDLTLLAEVYLSRSLRMAQKELNQNYGKPLIKGLEGKTYECRFSIIGMGKFGGRELGFGSDLDVIFVYEGDGQTEGKKSKPIQNQEYFAKLATLIYDLAGAITSVGFAYKIDTDLRPEGKKGILALPISGFKKYFEERASLWERQSLTRARFIVGAESLGKKFIKIAHDFAYESRFEYGAPAEMHSLRMKMEKESGKETRLRKNVKVGYGGMVDIEFIAQFLQLKFGGKFESLRNTRTLDVLNEAHRIGLLSTEHYNKLIKSFNFFKPLINALRIDHERSDNKIPESEEKQRQLALRMGYANREEKKGKEVFLKDYFRYTHQVREIYNSFFVVKE